MTCGAPDFVLALLTTAARGLENIGVHVTYAGKHLNVEACQCVSPAWSGLSKSRPLECLLALPSLTYLALYSLNELIVSLSARK